VTDHGVEPSGTSASMSLFKNNNSSPVDSFAAAL